MFLSVYLFLLFFLRDLYNSQSETKIMPNIRFLCKFYKKLTTINFGKRKMGKFCLKEKLQRKKIKKYGFSSLGDHFRFQVCAVI